MIIYCRGKAIIEQNGTGQLFEIEPDLLDFEGVGGSERSMGPEYQYQALIEHEVLGELSWGLWEYPVGVENYKDTDVGEHRLVQDFDYGLEHEEEIDFEQQELDERATARAGFADLSEEEQIDTMVGWFNRMFEDPQKSTPYAIDKESPYNYEYIWGGPYDASEELQDEFAGIASDEAIERATEIVQDQDGIFEWAPSDNHPDMRRRDEETLAEQFDDEPTLENIRERLAEGPTLTIGTEEEVRARSELMALIDDFQPLFARASSEPMHGGMGHNQPPAECEIPANLSLTINNNISVIVAQAQSTEPDIEATTESVGILQAAWGELTDFVKMTKDQVKSLGSKALAGAIVTGLGALVWKGISWISVLLGIPLF